jgi:hypothetical protein
MVEDVEQHRFAIREGSNPSQCGDRGRRRRHYAKACARDNVEDEVSFSEGEGGPRVDPFGTDALLEALKAAHGHEPLNLRDVVFPAKNMSSHGRRGR